MVTPWQQAQIEDQRMEVFSRVQRVFRWTVAGAITAAAVIVGVVAQEIPGRSAGATPTPSGASAPAPTVPAGSTGVGPSNGTGTGTGTGSAVTPSQTQQAPVAVSGGTGW